MEVLTTNFNGTTLRYSLVSDNGVLFNTVDICWILKIFKPFADEVLYKPCLNIAEVIKAALTDGRSNTTFIDWIESEFLAYDVLTPIEPYCDDDWKLK